MAPSLRQGVVLAGVLLLGMAAARAQVPQDNDSQRARGAAQAALEAVAQPGAFVCRPLTVGMMAPDWIRGRVLAVHDGRLQVRIAQAGQYPHTLAGADLTPGAEVWDAAAAWTPCRD